MYLPEGPGPAKLCEIVSLSGVVGDRAPRLPGAGEVKPELTPRDLRNHHEPRGAGRRGARMRGQNQDGADRQRRAAGAESEIALGARGLGVLDEPVVVLSLGVVRTVVVFAEADRLVVLRFRGEAEHGSHGEAHHAEASHHEADGAGAASRAYVPIG